MFSFIDLKVIHWSFLSVNTDVNFLWRRWKDDDHTLKWIQSTASRTSWNMLLKDMKRSPSLKPVSQLQGGKVQTCVKHTHDSVILEASVQVSTNTWCIWGSC